MLCKDCRWWYTGETKPGITKHECRHLHMLPLPPVWPDGVIVVWGAGDISAPAIVTGESFGCIHFTPKDSPAEPPVLEGEA